MEKEATKPGFKITSGRGFHITFDNGWTVSVQFGSGNYAGNYDLPFDAKPLPSQTAEIAAWNEDGWYDFGDDTVAGWKSPAEVLAFMKEIEEKPR